MTAPFKVGDRVWVARYGSTETRVPCPVCFGTKAVTLILGNGEQMRLECDYCAKGYGLPQGTIAGVEYAPRAEERVIDRVSVSATDVEYQSDCTIFRAPDVFATEAEALARAAVIAVQAEAERNARLEAAKEHAMKSYSWNAGYHMREAKELRERAERHERKAALCKAKAKSGTEAA